MSKKLIIIGNGLGMAIEPNDFSLTHVMPKVWQEKLEPTERELIASCIPGIEASGPTDETQLMTAQIVQLGHELITDTVNNENIHLWFTDGAVGYPKAIGKFVYEVARQLNVNAENQKSNSGLKCFLDGLVKHVHSYNSHVATLNYDTLLYSAFNEEYQLADGSKPIRLCDKFDGSLVDGYTRSAGFTKSNFERKNCKDFGYYLHLHGSPLFVGDPGKKLNRAELALHMPNDAKHIILSDGVMKPYLIQRSKILKLYWDQLSECIEEAQEVILFGYGGGDDHLNERLADAKATTKWVIEWSQTTHALPASEIIEGEGGAAKQYWTKKLGQNVQVKRLDNILYFTEWDSPDEHIPF